MHTNKFYACNNSSDNNNNIYMNNLYVIVFKMNLLLKV